MRSRKNFSHVRLPGTYLFLLWSIKYGLFQFTGCSYWWVLSKLYDTGKALGHSFPFLEISHYMYFFCVKRNDKTNKQKKATLSALYHEVLWKPYKSISLHPKQQWKGLDSTTVPFTLCSIWRYMISFENLDTFLKVRH